MSHVLGIRPIMPLQPGPQVKASEAGQGSQLHLSDVTT